jgi:hypothetical protein
MFAAMPLEEGNEGEGIGELPRVRLVERADQGIVVEDCREVEERARPGSDRDPVEDGALVGGEAGEVGLDSRDRTPRRRGRDRRTARPAPKPPLVAARTMAENGAGAAAKDGSQPQPADGQGSVSNRVDAAMDAVETTRCEADLDGAGREADPT